MLVLGTGNAHEKTVMRNESRMVGYDRIKWSGMYIVLSKRRC